MTGLFPQSQLQARLGIEFFRWIADLVEASLFRTAEIDAVLLFGPSSGLPCFLWWVVSKVSTCR